MKSSLDLFLILDLISKSGQLKNRIRLQKLVVIANKKYKINTSFKFFKYHYGPYSSDLKNFVDSLILDGVIKEEESKNPRSYSYTLTKSGESLLKEMKKDVDPKTEKKISNLIFKYGHLNTQMIVSTAKKLFGY